MNSEHEQSVFMDTAFRASAIGPLPGVIVKSGV